MDVDVKVIIIIQNNIILFSNKKHKKIFLNKFIFKSSKMLIGVIVFSHFITI